MYKTIEQLADIHHQFSALSNLEHLGFHGMIDPNLKADCENTVSSLQNKLGKLGDRQEVIDKLGSLIGSTDLQAIDSSAQKIQLKRELDNPSGSHYDRAYFATITQLESDKTISVSDELRDITSGSAGISLSLISTIMGYRPRITVPAELPANRVYPMLVYGAEVINAGFGHVPMAAEHQLNELIELDTNNQMQKCRPIDRRLRSIVFKSNDSRICYLNHSENDLTKLAFSSIGKELTWQAKPPEALFLGIGNWTTIAGITPLIRSAWPETKIIGYEGQNTNTNHDNFGTSRDGVRIRFEDADLLDDIVRISDRERDAAKSTLQLGEFGNSTLMGVAAAMKINVDSAICLAYDNSLRY